MLIDSRSYSSGTGYRYGFNGKYKDNEISGNGNQYDYGFRIYNPRLGKFLSVDPLTNNYAFYTPYAYAGNKPIKFMDLDGLETYDPDLGWMQEEKLKPDQAIKVYKKQELIAKQTNKIQNSFPLQGEYTAMQRVLDYDLDDISFHKSSENKITVYVSQNGVVTELGYFYTETSSFKDYSLGYLPKSAIYKAITSNNNPISGQPETAHASKPEYIFKLVTTLKFLNKYFSSGFDKPFALMTYDESLENCGRALSLAFNEAKHALVQDVIIANENTNNMKLNVNSTDSSFNWQINNNLNDPQQTGESCPGYGLWDVASGEELGGSSSGE